MNKKKNIRKILIANRGEIACRIIKTAKKLGIRTVAVYSDADKNALHALSADEAFYIGGSKSAESYLAINKIIAAALESDADAIHPGYGFLSENTQFAKACRDNEIIFIGPPVEAIAAMGSKSMAKKIMEQANVPLIPGYHGEEQSELFLASQAQKIGYPIMLKAAAGGGGKGMRIVHSSSEFLNALISAKREAKNYFSDDKMLIEKYFAKPRHIEIQVFGDCYGNYVHLFERDCSIQRRHQKIIEEAPAPLLDAKLQQAIAASAIKAAKAINYQGAGTVEFLLDEKNNFFFMEMNTRLQVEHPVTEMITHLDLVAWQIHVAEGKTLPKTQQEIEKKGHAIEVRLYAEDPYNNFLPSIGTIEYLAWPTRNETIRVDTGFVNHDIVSQFYDPMLAKIIVWGENRATAILKMQKALFDLRIIGLKTNVDFLKRLISHPKFLDAAIDTNFIDNHSTELLTVKTKMDAKLIAVAALFHIQQKKQTMAHCIDHWSPWNCTDGWRANLISELNLTFLFDQEKFETQIIFHPKELLIKIDGHLFTISELSIQNDKIQVSINNRIETYFIFQSALSYHIFFQNKQYQIDLYDPIAAANLVSGYGHSMTAPMPGTIIDINVKNGDNVKTGDKLITMEAMKMEHSIYAPTAGTIKEVLFSIGDMVSEGSELLIFEAEEA